MVKYDIWEKNEDDVLENYLFAFPPDEETSPEDFPEHIEKFLKYVLTFYIQTTDFNVRETCTSYNKFQPVS